MLSIKIVAILVLMVASEGALPDLESFGLGFTPNIRRLLGQAKYLSVIRHDLNATSTDRVDDFGAELIRRLNELTPLPVMVLSASELYADEDGQLISKYSTEKQIIFVLFEEADELRLSPDDFLFRNKDRSYYFLVVMSKTLDGIQCGSAGMIDALKQTMGEFFERMWRDLHLLEVTVIWPFLCDKAYALKYDPIKAFNRTKHSDGVVSLAVTDEMTTHNYRDFESYPIFVNIFYRVPTFIASMPQSSLEAYAKDMKTIPYLGGLDGYALGTMITRLNLTPILKESKDNAEYGYKRPDGSFSGSIGDVITKKADISMNARFLKSYGSEDVEFTTPVYYDQFCVLVPKSLTVPAWMSIFLVFRIQVWSVIGVTFLISSIVWWLMKAKYPPRGARKSNDPECFMLLDIWMLMISSPLIVMPQINPERLLVTSCLIFNLIFAGLFQGYLSTAYSTTSYYADISTLAQLDESGLPISTKNSDIFGINITRVSQSLSQKIIADKKDAIAETAEQRNLTVVERRTDADLVINLNFTSKDGQQKLHIVNECPRSYHLAYIVYKGYPFLPFIDRFFQKTVEAGLNNKWYQDTKFSLLLKHRQSEESKIIARKLDIIDVQTSFWVLFYGLTASIVIFVFELIINWIKMREKKKNMAALVPVVYQYTVFVK